jgi:CheY-like chemotaxis protein
MTNSLQVLVVEDDPDGANMVMLMLKSANIGTAVASSAEAALARLKSAETYDAVVIDLALPEMDGFQLLSVLREMPTMNGIPLVAVTAYHTPELKVKVLDAGFDAYFPKPIDTTIFLQSLDRLLKR